MIGREERFDEEVFRFGPVSFFNEAVIGQVPPLAVRFYVVFISFYIAQATEATDGPVKPNWQAYCA